MTRQAAVVYGIKVPTGGSDPVILANGAQTDFVNAWAEELDSEVTIGPAAVSIGQDGGDNVVGEASTTAVGTNATSSPTPQVAALIRLRTARGGKRGRGRKYLPWAMAEGEVGENGVIVGGQVAQLQARADSWRITAAAAGRGLVILHSPSAPGSLNPTTPGAPDDVTSTSVDSLVATQRRRLGR
jgi:hypothetical protein